MKQSSQTSNEKLTSYFSGLTLGEERSADKYLTFKVAGEIYGTSIGKIKEIIEHCKITRVPLTPREIQGVINLRGSVVPVIDLAARIGKPSNKVSKRTCIVICEIVNESVLTEIGFLVDEVDQVIDISDSDVEEPPQFGADINVEFIGGMGGAEESFIVLLNIDEVLSVPELSALISSQVIKSR